MQLFTDNIQDQYGNAVDGASVLISVSVDGSPGAAATIYADNGVTPKANPLTTNTKGEFSFYAAGGTYIPTVTISGGSPVVSPAITLFDPDDLSASSGSSLVGFIQAGTGAVARTMQEKAREIVSVTDFKNDDETWVDPGEPDNTTGFATAKAAIIARGGGALFIPVGSFTGSITCGATDDNFAIIGEDWNTTVIEAKDNATATLSVASGCHYVTVENLSIKNTGATNNGTHYGIHSAGDGAGNGASGLTLRRVKVSGYNINIRLDEFNNHTLESVVPTGAVHGGAAAPAGANIYAGHPTIDCVGLYMRDIHPSGGKYGFYMENTEGIQLSDSEVLSTSSHGFIHKVTAGTSVGMQMANVAFDSTGDDALYLEGVEHGSFTNVWCSATTGAGLHLVDSRYNSFIGLQAYGCSSYGVQLELLSKWNTFTGGTIRNNGAAGAFIDAGDNFGNSFVNVTNIDNAGSVSYDFDDASTTPNMIEGGYNQTISVQPKDIVRGGNNSLGRTLTLPFFRQNIADGAGATNAYFTPDQINFYCPYTGSLVGLSISLNDTRAAGALNVRPTVNGAVKDALLAQINAGAPQYAVAYVANGTVPVTAGQTIAVYYDTDAGWDTTGGAGTVDMSVTLIFDTQ
jgi:hypothetical protein